jgi:hypothetical protein
VESPANCYQLRKRRRLAVELNRPAKRGRAPISAELAELSSDRIVLLVPGTLEIGESIQFRLQSRSPEVDLTGEGEVRWVWYTSDGLRRTVCDLSKKFAPELLEALCTAGLVQPRDPSTRRLPVPVKARWELEPATIPGTIEAFSRDGFYFFSPHPPKQGGRLMVLLDGDDRKPIQLPARARAQQPLRQGYLLECSYESARGYELLGNFIYPPDAPRKPPAPPTAAKPTLSTFSQCGIVAFLYLAWFAQVCA